MNYNGQINDYGGLGSATEELIVLLAGITGAGLLGETALVCEVPLVGGDFIGTAGVVAAALPACDCRGCSQEEQIRFFPPSFST